jgi:hypothetical protein
MTMLQIGWGVLAKVGRVSLPPLFLAFGVTAGGGILGAFGQWLVGQSGADAGQMAFRIRIWAVAIAIGGTMTAFEHLERGLSQGALPQIVKDLLILSSAYAGAQVAYWGLRGMVL